MGEISFSLAAMEDRQLNFLVKIPMTYAHLNYTLSCPSAVGSDSNYINLIFKVS